MPIPEALTGASEIPSPCTQICRIGHYGHCLGCGRDLDEITAWARAGAAERLAIRARAAARLLEFPQDKDLA